MYSPEPLQRLYQLADGSRPPGVDQYVEPKRSVVEDVVSEVVNATGQVTKHLLYGAVGSGKSSQLRAIARGLAHTMTLVDIDFDASGIAVGGISAFDIAYVIGVRTLRHVSAEHGRPLFAALTKAYAEDDSADVDALGGFEEALGGLAGFGGAVSDGVKALQQTSAPVQVVTAVLKAGHSLLKLRTKPAGLVAETSPRGRRLQEALEAIFEAARAAHGGRAIAVVLDGLEKTNGNADGWLRNTFEYTRLLTDTSVTIIAAAPPSPFGQTNSAASAGWTPRVVWGFAPDDFDRLTEALRLRVAHAGIEPGSLDDVCAQLAHASGGHPRHAMLMLRYAVNSAMKAKRAMITADDVASATARMRDELAMGLTAGHYATLRKVQRDPQLPDDDLAMVLFRDGRLLVHPPVGGRSYTFHVHPLIAEWVDASGTPPKA